MISEKIFTLQVCDTYLLNIYCSCIVGCICLQNCTVAFQGSSAVRLNMSVRWCPAIEDDFLIDVPLKPYNVVIGGVRSKYKKQSR